MQRFYRVLADPRFQVYNRQISKLEAKREFCGHDQQHLLDTARLAWILTLEEKLDFSREIVYTAAFLHDIGRWCEYEDEKIDHAAAGADLARPLLETAGFERAEVDVITAAIAEHRLLPQECATPLGRLLSAADDLSRRCFDCTAAAECCKYGRMPAQERPVY
ncbi:MAG: HD domain-containing protein [Firmicutes bacterium]|nr:HD domain-containing protein [Bacillota bacterium]